MVATNIAIACQGGGSHAAYSAGVLPALLPRFANAALAQSQETLAGQGGNEALNLVGVSGTSGGAITALLAWYGFLVGGPDTAAEKLDAFWTANCAQWPGEQLWNTSAVSWANAVDYDLKFSPYRPPLLTAEAWATGVWPAVARVLGDANHWMRADFFKLDELIRPHVNFDLVAALGAFCSIAQEVKRWLAVELETGMVDPGAARREQLGQARQRIERRITDKLAMLRELEWAMETSRVPPDALLRVALQRWRAPPCVFEAGALQALSDEVLRVTRELPQLLIGSVRIDDGDFTAFSSERPPEEGGISLAAVLASAALPWLFEAQEMRQFDPDRDEQRWHAYWDGLFSQNPPIRNFMSGLADQAKKPDGIWVVQINPERFDTGSGGGVQGPKALAGNAIWPTRDALSGNLSLNQEVAFVEAINRRIDEDGAAAGADKHIAVHRIVMDGAAVAGTLGRPLGVASKFDRSAALKAALVAHGRAQGERFLALRAELQEVGGNFGAILQQLAAPGAAAPMAGAGSPGTGAGRGVRDARLVVDGITVHRQAGAGAGAGDAALASVRWRALGGHLDGTRVRIEGSSGLYGGADGGSWRLCDMSVNGSGGGARGEGQAGGTGAGT